VGSTLVAMATTFALGAESSRLPACLHICVRVSLVHFQVSPTGVSAVSKAARNAVVTSLMVSSHFAVSRFLGVGLWLGLGVRVRIRVRLKIIGLRIRV